MFKNRWWRPSNDKWLAQNKGTDKERIDWQRWCIQAEDNLQRCRLALATAQKAAKQHQKAYVPLQDMSKLLIRRDRVDELLLKENHIDAIAEVWGHLRALQENDDCDSSLLELRLADLLDAAIMEGG